MSKVEYTSLRTIDPDLLAVVQRLDAKANAFNVADRLEGFILTDPLRPILGENSGR
ncbi:hypothetical protein [Nonomuraea deserti]|uniref:hypothetical protein n=1 Tax=Nonomuraea deserti TaxID=1848322 RepID=UPI001404D688|nr:hypothetical protein [Nonomuraea deserti]